MPRPRFSSSFALAASVGLWPFLAAGTVPSAAGGSARGEQVVAHVNGALRWYRQVQAGAGWIGEPSDRIYFDSEHAMADQVVQLAFSAAEADAAALPPPAAGAKGQSATTQALLKSEADTAAKVGQLQQKVADLDRQLPAAPDAGRSLLQTQRDEAAAELNLAKTTHDALAQVAAFATKGDGDVASLDEQIAELKGSIPEAFDPSDATKVPEMKVIGAGGGGILGRTEALYALFNAMRGVEALDEATGQPLPPAVPQSGLEAIVYNLRQPLLTSIRGVIQQGKDASAQASSADEDKLSSLRTSVDQLSGQLRALTGASVPLRQEQILLAQTHQNLALWRASLQQQQDAIIRALVLHAVELAVLLAILLGFSELWRRATFRYVHDLRRRRQFLLIRRFTTAVVVVLVVLANFVSDYSSIATYAGFLTAGIAVALQTVIVSVAAYFLLIGRYGVRVGDRLTVTGVTGDVVEIGLVRFYMMELAGTGVELHPTGRVAVFANSVLFQPTPIYRQMPGTDYTWHEAVVPLTNPADFDYITAKLLQVANVVYEKYKPILEQQHVAIERLVDLKLDVPAPASQLRFNDKGVDLVLRYPVDIHHSVDTDNAMASQLLEAIRADEKISGATTGLPRIQALVRV